MLTIRDMMAGSPEAIRAYGTSEGALAGWETRQHSLGSHKAAGQVHRVLRSHGFKAKSVEDRGTGRFAQTVMKYEHPDGHTATVSRSEAHGPSNYLKVTSKDDEVHDKVENDLKKKSLI